MVATFHLHYLGHRIKYGNLEVGNTTQQLLSTTLLCCSIEFIESFLLWVSFVTYNIGIYICIYVYKVSYIHSFFFFFLLFSTVMFFLHCMLSILRYEKIFFVKLMSRLLHNTIHQVIWDFWLFIVNPFSMLWSIFFSRKLRFLWFLYDLLITELVSLDTSGKPTVGFF